MFCYYYYVPHYSDTKISSELLIEILVCPPKCQNVYCLYNLKSESLYNSIQKYMVMNRTHCLK